MPKQNTDQMEVAIVHVPARTPDVLLAVGIWIVIACFLAAQASRRLIVRCVRVKA